MPLPKPLLEIRKSVEDCISEAEPLKALQYLQELLPQGAEKRSVTIQLAGQLNSANEEYRGGRIEFKERQMITANVVKAISDLTYSLSESDFEPKSSAPSQAAVAKIPKFVVIYHELDKAQFEMLDKHWSVLMITNQIQAFDVNETHGEEPITRAETEILNADYILVLVTINLFNRKPGWFNLVVKAITEGRRVIPLRVGDVSFEGLGLEKFKSLPSMGRAVSDFPNVDSAYADIVGELRKLLPK